MSGSAMTNGLLHFSRTFWAQAETRKSASAQDKVKWNMSPPGENCVVNFTVMRGWDSHFTVRCGELEW